MSKTLLDRVWESHVVRRADGVPDLLYVDLHLVHEVTSPQAFEGLRLAGRPVRRPDLTLATMDHNVPTGDDMPTDPLSELQLATLARNCDEFGVPIYATGSGREGIVHVIGPELGLTQPGMTIVCGDSHTSTHGAVGALAFGIGTSEVEHVLATQTLSQRKPGSLRIRFVGEPAPGVGAKDYVLAAIGDADERAAAERALAYMALEPGTPIREIEVERVFIGSCTNSRIEDLRVAAEVVQGRRVHPGVRAMVVPGSAQVKLQAETEGLDRIFIDAGFEWRRAGCSMCLGMNPDVLAPGERCASTSNRNFEGRQGAGGRTHLVSPSVAAATAVMGHFAEAHELVEAPV